MKQYQQAVVIGRFQIAHNGHLKIFSKAFELADYVNICIGSSGIAPDCKNPFSFDERVSFINGILKEAGYSDKRYTFTPLYDDTYNNFGWSSQIHESIKEVERVAVSMKVVSPDDTRPKIVLVGHKKDDTEYYIRMFSWPFIDVDAGTKVTASTIRRHMYTHDNVVGAFIPPYMSAWLDQYTQTESFKIRKDEFEFIEKGKEIYSNLPYGIQFNTVDAFVVCMDNLLLIKRRAQPGKGLWALPGGYLNANEWITDGILRELEEETRIAVPTDQLRASLKDIQFFDSPARSQRGRIITHCGLIVLETKMLPKVRGSDDAERAKWFPIGEVLQNMRDKMFEDHFSIIRNMTGRIENKR